MGRTQWGAGLASGEHGAGGAARGQARLLLQRRLVRHRVHIWHRCSGAYRVHVAGHGVDAGREGGMCCACGLSREGALWRERRSGARCRFGSPAYARKIYVGSEWHCVPVLFVAVPVKGSGLKHRRVDLVCAVLRRSLGPVEFAAQNWMTEFGRMCQRGCQSVHPAAAMAAQGITADVQVRVTQGKEPAHFVAMWQGEMRVYEGGVASGFRTVQEEDETGGGDDSTRLFQVRGVGRCPPYASQVPAAAASLNSGTPAAWHVPMPIVDAEVWRG